MIADPQPWIFVQDICKASRDRFMPVKLENTVRRHTGTLFTRDGCAFLKCFRVPRARVSRFCLRIPRSCTRTRNVLFSAFYINRIGMLASNLIGYQWVQCRILQVWNNVNPYFALRKKKMGDGTFCHAGYLIYSIIIWSLILEPRSILYFCFKCL